MTNTQSLNNKFDEFTTVVREGDFDIISVSETWFTDEIPEQVYNISGYSMLCKNRIGRRGGGVALYVRDEMHPTPVCLTTVPPEHEIVWVQLRPHRLPRTVSSIFVATVYSPPNNPDSESLIQHISQAIDDILAKYQQAGIIILGDVNPLNLSQLINGHG